MSERKKCLGCGEESVEVFLDLGLSPLANGYLKPEDASADEPRFPLATGYCHGCHLVQLTHTVDPAKLFSHYLYFSSFSPAFLEHSKKLADSMVDRFDLGAEDFVVEIASNDGYLLQYFQERGVPVLGVEPAENIAKVATEKGIPTKNAFFGTESSAEVAGEHGKADLILGLNVLAHVPDINPFVKASADLIKDDGVVCFEAPWLLDFLEGCEFDTIYHELVYYYSISALRILFERAGLELFDALPQPTHGGSIRVLFGKPGAHEVQPAVAELLAREEQAGLTSPEVYREFATRVEALKAALVEKVRSYKSDGKRLVTYGASAKGNTLLNYFDLGTDVFDYACDRSTYKQGHVTPGKHLPIVDPVKLVEDKPDYAVMLTWNFAEEILEQQKEYIEGGGTFIIPIPELREVSA